MSLGGIAPYNRYRGWSFLYLTWRYRPVPVVQVPSMVFPMELVVVYRRDSKTVNLMMMLPCFGVTTLTRKRW